MLAGCRRRAVARPLRAPDAVARPLRAPDRVRDSGASLVEFLVAISVITVVMTSLTSFFVATVSTTSQQSGKQVAIQLAEDGLERARALKGSAVATGRDRSSTDTQWTRPVAGVAPYLAGMQETWDASAVFPAGATAALPTTAQTVTISGVPYSQNWYVGKCWQPAAGGACGTVQAPGSVEFYSVVVAVTWPERHCTGTTCSYVMSTLVSDAAADPAFGAAAGPPPAPTSPGNLGADLTVPVSLRLTATGGNAPITWSGSGLPAGLTIDSSGLISGTPTTAAAYAVTVRTIDALGLVGSAAFTYTVNALPTLRSPGNQNGNVGVAVNLAIALTGGTGPMAWSVTKPGPWGATGLPPGLSIDPLTGVISGRPTTVGPRSNVTVTVTDALGQSASVTFGWRIR